MQNKVLTEGAPYDQVNSEDLVAVEPWYMELKPWQKSGIVLRILWTLRQRLTSLGQLLGKYAIFATRSMRLEHWVTVNEPIHVIWNWLWDVKRLCRCIPGCERVEVVEEHKRYNALVAVEVGYARPVFTLDIRIEEVKAPCYVKVWVTGKNTKLGTLKQALSLKLTELAKNETELRVTAEVTVFGVLSSFVQGVLRKKVEGLMSQFANAIKAELTNSSPPNPTSYPDYPSSEAVVAACRGTTATGGIC